MRHYPTDESDRKDAEQLRAEPWMLDQLKLNPDYVSWGPHEDYMWKEGDGWDSRSVLDTWADFGPWTLNDLNEVVNFYFGIDRDGKPCPVCGDRGYHPDAQWITESFYTHSSPFTTPTPDEDATKALLARLGGQFTPSAIGRGSLPPDAVVARYGKPFLEFCVRTMERGGAWHDDITQDEADALVEAGRYGPETFHKETTANAINAVNSGKAGLDRHDAINRCILVEQRCNRLGVPLNCERCDGHGHVFTTDTARLVLTLWVLHPRKGCSRGVEVKDVRQEDLPAIYAYLREAAERNAERFSKVPAPVTA